MEELYSRVYAEINLDAIRENMAAMKANLPEKTRLIGVVKADGYGHGAVPVAKAIAPYVWGYAVAVPEEALILRNHGIDAPVLILGSVSEEWFPVLIEKEIRPALFETEKAQALSQAAVSAGKKALVHIAVDTGMSRIGVSPDAQGIRTAEAIAAMPGIEIEGLFTHFARADESDKAYTFAQFEKYRAFVNALREKKIHIPICHCANSAAIMELPDMGMDAARAGISMYGLYPSEEMKRDMVLHPAMEIRSFLTYVKEIEAGTPVSYGGTFVAEHRMRIGTVGAG